MDYLPKDIRHNAVDLELKAVLWDNSVTQTNGSPESLQVSNNSEDQSLGVLILNLANGLSDIRTKVEEEHKEFFELVAQGRIFKMQPTQEFAYNMMRGKGLGAQPVFPPPRASTQDEEDYRPIEHLEDNLQSGVKYYKVTPKSDFINDAAAQELVEGVYQLGIEERPRCEIVFDQKGDEGETNNHYKGKQVWGNFGYLFVNGTWVDPDSEKDLAHAFKGYPVLSLDELEGARAKDSRIMSPAQMEEFYDFFNEYVSDDEGDPRNNRLSLKEFQNMVHGTASEGKGDTWAKAVVAPQEKYTERPREPRNPKIQTDMLPPQIDKDTGSYYSGYGGDNSDTASILLSAAGVDILQRPEHFNRMDPRTDMNILAEAYGSPNAFKDDSGWSDTTILPVFNTKAAAKAITWDLPDLTDEEREAGLAYITSRGEAHFQHSQVMAKNRDELKSDKMIAFSGLAGCMKELFFIKQWLNNNSCKANDETRRLVDSISLEAPFRRTERTMISKNDPAPVATTDPYLGLSDQARIYMRLINDIYQDTNNLTLHLQNQAMVWGATKAEIEVKIGEYFGLRERIMAVSGMTNDFIQSLIPIGAPRTPRINF
ncbi:hypothetical protein sscle_08g066160 [Sclerotinia sclerotiorum 1980 UF-70]|uniref:Uncharacterized protein n=1 Tax=Sclerotinia sclerotiorum (strain ATCC 18683 / 1980 / Ss-1) TaxID=665079 RepID=A0A1D9QAA7_SCLS1|nr:hypothetical protein sscle_08g066160 [Sclerotinia sclerotiorum 1980 UF-70]